VRGKGDAMLRAVHGTRSDIVCFLDADSRQPHPSHLRGLLGPLLTMPNLQLVKGAFSGPCGSATILLSTRQVGSAS
jgi:glucosyl-3-phosphoglycerate synthase